ncbi:protocatechuate 3,4-dioxygenase subunit alpha [Limibaculum sp. M0105]|uniref:Protocatechuate 3,4-dioxygenase subunit alpha n=1 Tax=Thermohalobaculum xanthum TaxID=2753746 RepID=A0A8J7M779_9RHOB|nr:protocatechuate 3,4-dioxygenase subunit alpha [Thermohalobaculum xanthum]MBK0399561.1 protocatechuate 3,4-dioxygenase subunit alpha [Thermohalobaculum xanthum]
MTQKLDRLKETPSQTAGPYVHIGLAPGAAGFEIFDQELGRDIAGPNARGERIRIEGTVYDGTGAPVKDVLIETWQANADGIHPHPADPRASEVEAGFRGWGRIISDFDTGAFVIETVKPGAVTGRNGRIMAPHISLWVVARGVNVGLQTRLYFADEAEANAADPVLGFIEQVHRRETLVAERTADGVYKFDIRLQGERETVFFDI